MNVSSTTFRRHVSQVVCVRAEKQMIGIDAQRVVTPMADEQSVGDIAVCQCPRKTVSAPGSITDLDTTITRSCYGVSPVPASPVDAINMIPEVGNLLSGSMFAGAFTRTADRVSSCAGGSPSDDRHRLFAGGACRYDASVGAGILIGHLTGLSLGATPRTVQPVAGFFRASIIPQIPYLHAETEALWCRYPERKP